MADETKTTVVKENAPLTRKQVAQILNISEEFTSKSGRVGRNIEVRLPSEELQIIFVNKGFYDRILSQRKSLNYVTIEFSQSITGKTTYKNADGKHQVHGKDEKGNWKAGMEQYDGQTLENISAVRSGNQAMFDKAAKKEIGPEIMDSYQKSYEETGDAAYAAGFANLMATFG